MNDLTCPACDGQGAWAVECCNGSGGCSCQGKPVPMGDCNVCRGTGVILPGEDVDFSANTKSITGLCFIGSGPSTGIWAGIGERGNY